MGISDKGDEADVAFSWSYSIVRSHIDWECQSWDRDSPQRFPHSQRRAPMNLPGVPIPV